MNEKTEQFKKQLLKIATMARREKRPDPVDFGAEAKRTAQAINDALESYEAAIAGSEIGKPEL